MKKTDKILVTGASGFIGSHLLRLLWEKGYQNLRATSYSRDLREDDKYISYYFQILFCAK